MNNELLSVIVPVYNVEEYLERCIESIIASSYKNIEIILINDGSTDKSIHICEKLKAKDERIKVFHKENEGVSSARNYGLENVKGEYITFVDSDDYIDKHMYTNLMNIMLKEDADIVYCDLVQVKSERDNQVDNKLNGYNIYEKDEFIKDFLLVREAPFLWNKVFKKNLFQGIKFPVGKIYEDEFVFYKLLHASKTIIHAKYIGYYYFWRDSSIMNSTFSQQQFDLIEAVEEVIHYINEHYPKYVKLAYYKYIYVNMLLYNKIRNFSEYEDEKNKLRSNIKSKMHKIPIFLLGKEELKLYITAILAILKLR